MVQTLILKLREQEAGYSFQTLFAENDPGNLWAGSWKRISWQSTSTNTVLQRFNNALRDLKDVLRCNCIEIASQVLKMVEYGCYFGAVHRKRSQEFIAACTKHLEQMATLDIFVRSIYWQYICPPKEILRGSHWTQYMLRKLVKWVVWT